MLCVRSAATAASERAWARQSLTSGHETDEAPPNCGWRSNRLTTRSPAATGSGASSVASATLYSVVVAPSASARVATTMAA